VSRNSLVRCVVRGSRTGVPPKVVEFRPGRDLVPHIERLLGPHGISPRGADLIDLAAAVFQIEKQLGGRKATNRPESFELRMPFRESQFWRGKPVELVQEILADLGNAVWTIEVASRGAAPVPKYESSPGERVRQIALFSGGLDSSCGAATLRSEASETKLVSFYTRQKTLQADLAEALGFAPPVQWRLTWTGGKGRGHSYLYRSFLFLALAGVTAGSWKARRILQFENGILATSIPPAPSFGMTRHAHPLLQRRFAELLSQVLGGRYEIENPFLLLTKRECVEAARKAAPGFDLSSLLSMTETCWYFSSNRRPGGSKKPGRPCGICIPCVIRRTALPDQRCELDLRQDRVRNGDVTGRVFRSYHLLLSMVVKCRTAGDFYGLLPGAGRELVRAGHVDLAALWGLFKRFAKEFIDAYGGTYD
jgi:7-cyano-7-deazaguanine synthase in queuosine biosynthesis